VFCGTALFCCYPKPGLLREPIMACGKARHRGMRSHTHRIKCQRLTSRSGHMGRQRALRPRSHGLQGRAMAGRLVLEGAKMSGCRGSARSGPAAFLAELGRFSSCLSASKLPEL
jgi:hypothetical protein